MALTAELAGRWLHRWDAQQEYYIADREERFTVIADLVADNLAARGDDPAPVVLDLGCGPGSLSARLAERLPSVRLIGLDYDPLLLGLGAANHPNVEFIQADLTGTEWTGTVPSTIDAAVSTTALHYLPVDRLRGLYLELGRIIRPGGLFVNGDHLTLDAPGLNQVAQRVRDHRATRAGVTANEEWRNWWDAVLVDPAFAELAQAREQGVRITAETPSDEQIEQDQHHHGSNGLSITDHVQLLRAAGFAEAAPVWQFGDDHVLAALR